MGWFCQLRVGGDIFGCRRNYGFKKIKHCVRKERLVVKKILVAYSVLGDFC